MSQDISKLTGRLAALDVGDVRIGVAVSDPGGLIAAPAGVVDRRQGDPVGGVVELLETSGGVAGIVVGLPRNMDGSEGIQAHRSRQFAERIHEALPDVPLIFRDERLSTIAARNLRLERGTGRKGRRQAIDSEAAAVILQNYLDYLRNRAGKPE